MVPIIGINKQLKLLNTIKIFTRHYKDAPKNAPKLSHIKHTAIE